MRYSTQIDNVKSLEWGLNLQEAYVFSFLYSAPSWASEVILKGKVYYFVSRNLACKEIPLFTDKPDTMYRCYKALEKKGLVTFIKIEGKDCVILTKKGKTWNTKIESESDYSENYPNKLGKLSETDSENNPTYKSTIINKSTIYKSNKEEEKSISKKKSKNLHLFSESVISELESFQKAFDGTAYENCNLEFYYESVKDWGLSKGAKKLDWVATSRGFMLRDKKDGKLQMKNGVQLKENQNGKSNNKGNGNGRFDHEAFSKVNDAILSKMFGD